MAAGVDFGSCCGQHQVSRPPDWRSRHPAGWEPSRGCCQAATGSTRVSQVKDQLVFLLERSHQFYFSWRASRICMASTWSWTRPRSRSDRLGWGFIARTWRALFHGNTAAPVACPKDGMDRASTMALLRDHRNDMTSAGQAADLCIYCINWGFGGLLPGEGDERFERRRGNRPMFWSRPGRPPVSRNHRVHRDGRVFDYLRDRLRSGSHPTRPGRAVNHDRGGKAPSCCLHALLDEIRRGPRRPSLHWRNVCACERHGAGQANSSASD